MLETAQRVDHAVPRTASARRTIPLRKGGTVQMEGGFIVYKFLDALRSVLYALCVMCCIMLCVCRYVNSGERRLWRGLEL